MSSSDGKPDDGRIWLTCRECKKDFYLAAKEADFFKEKGFCVPKSCHGCRQWRKLEKEKGDGQK